MYCVIYTHIETGFKISSGFNYLNRKEAYEGIEECRTKFGWYPSNLWSWEIKYQYASLIAKYVQG